jgi:hypothetical protein
MVPRPRYQSLRESRSRTLQIESRSNRLDRRTAQKLGRFLRYKTKHANDVRAHLKLLEGFKRKRRIETRETAAAALKQSKVDLKTEKEITKRNKSEKLALLEALSPPWPGSLRRSRRSLRRVIQCAPTLVFVLPDNGYHVWYYLRPERPN